MFGPKFAGLLRLGCKAIAAMVLHVTTNFFRIWHVRLCQFCTGSRLLYCLLFQHATECLGFHEQCAAQCHYFTRSDFADPGWSRIRKDKRLVYRIRLKTVPATTVLLNMVSICFFWSCIGTLVLTARVAWLVKEKGINPRNMLVVTFTNKAANEMRERLSSEDFLGDTSKQLLMGTFHSFCANFLRRHGSKVGIPNNFTIADSEDS